ncbi:MAG: hypothetical protein ACHQSE_12465 [Gemmatimonadales bacterium]
MSDPLQLTLRVIHVFGGIFWAGSVFFLLRFLMPAIAGSGSGGQAVQQQLMTKQKLGVFIPLAALLTVLSGLGMYARNVVGSSGVWVHSRPGVTYGVGGLAAIIALVIGATIIGPSLEKIVKIQLAAQTSGRALTADEAATVARMGARSAGGTRVVARLLVITVAAMAIGRYV